MHNKANLMTESNKIQRVIKREIAEAPHETLLVLDATTGQNAISQKLNDSQNQLRFLDWY